MVLNGLETILIIFRFPVISKSEQEKFIKLVNEIDYQKKENIDTTELESEIDQMVYELYGLTEDEIKVVEGSIVMGYK